MPTRRTPIRPNLRSQLTPAAIAAFRRMIDEGISRAEWLKCEDIISRELRTRPWEFPCIKAPDEPAGDHWDELAQARWAALAAAL